MKTPQMTFHSSKIGDTSHKGFTTEYSTIIQVPCPVDTQKLWCQLRDCGKFVSDLHFLTHLLNLQKLWDTGYLKVASTFDDNQDRERDSEMAENDQQSISEYEEKYSQDVIDNVDSQVENSTDQNILAQVKTEFVSPNDVDNTFDDNGGLQQTNGNCWNLKIKKDISQKDNTSDSSDIGDDAIANDSVIKCSNEIEVDHQVPSLTTHTEVIEAVSTPQTQAEYEELEMRKRPLRKRLKKIVQSEEEEKPCKADEVEKTEVPSPVPVKEEIEEEEIVQNSKKKTGAVKRWSTRRLPSAATAYMKVMCIGGRISPDRKPSSSTNTLVLKSTRIKNKKTAAIDAAVKSSSSKLVCSDGAREFKCPVCETIVNSKKELVIHLQSEHAHSTSEQISCVVCKLKIESQEELVRHLQSHAEKAYTCDKCSLRFANRHRLNVHQFEHLTDEAKEDFRCDVCGKPCYSKCYLQRHRRRHTGERPYMCDVCGKVYFEMSTLNTHRRSHTGERYTCLLCGNRYMQKSALNLHMKSAHEGIKEHMCEMCGKAFFDKHHLQKHIRIHTGEKPYQCDFCGKSFTQKVNRDQHRRLHTGEQPYRCEYCFRMFALRAAYTQHVRKHTGVKVSELKRVQLEKLQSELNKKHVTSAKIDAKKGSDLSGRK